MKKSITLASLAAIGVAALVASPAFAAQTRTLPANNTYYAIDCQNNDGMLVTVDVTTSVATVVGANTPTPNTSCAYQAAWDSASETLYWSSMASTVTLMKADLTTGASTEVAPFSVNSSNSVVIAIDDQSNAYAITESNVTPGADAVYSLNLTTGAMTWLADIQNLGGLNSCIYTFAFNPADNKFYLSCSLSPLDTSIRQVDVSTGTTTEVCNNAVGSGMYGFAFDENGIGWTADGGFSDLVSFDITQADCGWQSGGRITLNSSNWYTEANAIVYTPSTPDGDPSGDTSSQLPTTGIDTVSTVVLGGVALGLIAGGAVLFRRRRA